ncbi:hypothetical protein [Streptomyces caniscabiei]|uniref:Terminase small subunit n=1 Tax=Streptomyces caniscabiei TaxID=2746961 RepID=A0ABU4MI80_9ACTN|nr:hypothetical protein [Streptomyces caniscabiei]MDX2953335.1 hypothetical protein [Streptomyces caniscabiei]MDX2987328.1 hypothetical protein [Streptomyces caniscabiei]MDX3009535.1 hypothetical protein [Streptomyces caniscabiei]MDX3037180.1 hypothetical protein [Streptomyces caniscabiei]
MSVADKIASEIDDLHAEETSPGMAAVALALAKAIDSTDVPASQAKAAHELRSIMSDLRKLAPVESKGDAVDDIAEQRAKRRAAAREQASG